MLKTIFCILCLTVSFSSFSAEKYIMVIFHGLGGFNSGSMEQAETVSSELRNVGVEKVYNGGHGVSKRKFSQVLDNFDCRNGNLLREDLGLIIIGYSWGARKSYDFSKTYLKKCGRKADRGYMLDGVQKLITQFRHAPVAQVCKNYYKTISPIRGRSLKNCENFDLTDICRDSGTTDGMRCHQMVLQKGMQLSMQDLQNMPLL